MINFKDFQIIKYNKTRFNFLKLVHQAFKTKNIENIIKIGNNDSIYKKLYELNDSKEFQTYYKYLLTLIKKNLSLNNFYYQKIPSFRIHRPGQKSVNFHNDVMYGHGESVINVWVSLTKTNENNSLYLVSDRKSYEIMKKFNNKKMSISELNNLSTKNAKPVITKNGEMLVFRTKSLHGTMINTSNETRISFDFRLLIKKNDSGTKTLNEFYLPFFSNKIVKKEVGLYFYKKNSFLNNLSHSDQRFLIQSYCKKNNFTPIFEETEIYNCDHYPNLDFILKNKKQSILVMTSILCLPHNKILRNKMIKKAFENKVEIHFVIENMKLISSNISKINKYYEVNLSNYILINK